MNARKCIKVFLLFLIAVAVYGGIVASVNHWYRSVAEHPSKSFTVILIGCTVYVYYRAWLWLCRKLDLLNKGKTD